MEDITREQKSLLGALEKLNISTPADLESIVSRQTVSKLETSASGKYPRISLFYGESGKGEVSYRAWKYEINCLIREHAYTNEGLLLGIRRSLRGEAADMAMRLGEKATIDDILRSFHAAFGNTETPESILKKFHGCVQLDGESVSHYAGRLEELHSQAVELDAVRASYPNLLKSVFYEGLHTDLKLSARYMFDKSPDYNNFKAEVRRLEYELGKAPSGACYSKKPCNAMTNRSEKESKSELGEVKSLLQQLNDRISTLEENQRRLEQQTIDFSNVQYREHQFQRGTGGQGNMRGRGPVSRGMENRGRGSFQPSRALGRNTFRPDYRNVQCFHCKETGHMVRDCPLNN